ncbi:MAG TPA: molybdate ABC transporter substrate-binding protein [Hyphomicrobiaceae bacterium]|jgi:molybdate transport system substrate-binding protein|nr:molybdate ABC transporter substrate-binding protein [Hyphomicrobiaceae bacterium]
MTKITAVYLVGLLAAAVLARPVAAADIKVLTAGAMRGVLVEMLPQFEKDTGHKVAFDNATAGTLAKRIEGGEAFDVAIITPKVIDALAGGGKIVPGSSVDVAKVGIGVAVKEGAPLPDIKTVEAFKRALLAAKSVAYIDPKAGGSSGIYFDGLLDRLGLAADVRPKAKLKQGGYVAELVASGEAEVAVHQISEIVPVKGVVLVGPLPAEIQNFTTYSAAIGASARDNAAARALVDYLAGPAAAAVLKTKGMEKP